MDRRNELAARVNELLPILATKLLHFVKDFPEPDITVPQAFLLNNLRRRGPSTASAIGEILRVTSGPVTSLTKRLIAKGLVSRHRDENDGRVVWFSLTEEGVRLAEELDRHSLKRWALVMDLLGLERSEEALVLLEDTIRVLNQFEKRPGSE
ncbi:MAG: hypothetical protein A2201_13820 [Alicyclobacillus sp. RIFOXYA1_FULL_53_8]|nr:MAG: hypothetical protein A2201_13820 [Alicyclobacillus sp. RIFOXYA1_FULL_53_8]